ncbi:NUDIX hydrolase [Paenibacillus sp. 481]|uniref:NUDIX hydrolase n=1 Tax=Paenibacillus sp. 481 TaxID=2835869 RepID=UPI001E44D7BD|nr:NUDIX domain-containing protein [Paenibacillus sp. 481]UHA72736.1 NUDIX domain-containing protein [Paenibacillus sp. 481]
MTNVAMERAPDAAGCIIQDEQGRVLLVHQHYGKHLWSMPGGVVDAGESAWDAAIRECKEELQIDVTQLELAGIYFLAHRNGYIYVFRVLEYVGTPQADGHEIDECGFFHLDELPRPITNVMVERIVDAVRQDKAVMKIQHLDDYVTLT